MKCFMMPFYVMKDHEIKPPVFYEDFIKRTVLKQEVAGRLPFLYVDLHSVVCH